MLFNFFIKYTFLIYQFLQKKKKTLKLQKKKKKIYQLKKIIVSRNKIYI